MRVKIAYTVELEEVESEVAEIMEKAATNLDEAYQQVIKIQSSLSSDDTGLDDLRSINNIRKKMMQADQVLEDCFIILEGYKAALKQIKEQENEIETR